MKIGIDARAAYLYRGTGIGTYTYQLINYLNKIDFQNKYSLILPEKASLNITFNGNFQTFYTNLSDKTNFWENIDLPINIADDDISIYHIPHNGIGMPNKSNKKIIVTLHDIIPYKMPETVSSSYLQIFNSEIEKILSMSDAIITVSNYSKDDIINTFNYPKDKIFVTHLASDKVYIPMDTYRCRLFIKKYYSIDSDFILYVGGYSPRKNLKALIEAYSILKKYHEKNIKLVIVGKKGISYDLYKNQVDKLDITDDVIFTGFIPLKHMPYFYNAASLFVFPSFYEGFGLPPLEAMSCGIPVIASNKTSIPEILNDGAYYINPNEVEDITYGMLKIIDDNLFRKQLILKGLKRSKQLTWDKTAAATIKAYTSI